jgi:hypothetical protein
VTPTTCQWTVEFGCVGRGCGHAPAACRVSRPPPAVPAALVGWPICRFLAGAVSSAGAPAPPGKGVGVDPRRGRLMVAPWRHQYDGALTGPKRMFLGQRDGRFSRHVQAMRRGATRAGALFVPSALDSAAAERLWASHLMNTSPQPGRRPVVQTMADAETGRH